MRIFLDANILFSAAKTDGAVRQLCRHLLDRGHECWADDYVVTEARRNLTRKGDDGEPELDALLARMHVAAAQAPGRGMPEADWLPEKDRPVLIAAMRLRCEALVTSDRTHFGTGYGKAFGGVTIHSPRSLAEALLG
jgi:hypothetical protein